MLAKLMYNTLKKKPNKHQLQALGQKGGKSVKGGGNWSISCWGGQFILINSDSVFNYSSSGKVINVIILTIFLFLLKFLLQN